MIDIISRHLRFKVLDERSVSEGTGKSDRLDTLKPGRTGRIVELSPECRGFERQRMMDLGLVPGSVVERDRQAPFGGPISFRLRGVTLALRPAQAGMVSIEPM